MPIVALIDYGMGNLGSMRRALEECGAQVVLVTSAEELQGITHIVLPGVGSFFSATSSLENRGFSLKIREVVEEQQIPLLGVCLGMQLLASWGDEGGGKKGLNLIPGQVVPFEKNIDRIPHVGWNEVLVNKTSRLLDGIISGTDFYFVHSYHFVVDVLENATGVTPYCGGFNSIVEKGNIFGTQFHPEKSQRAGFQLLRNFLEI